MSDTDVVEAEVVPDEQPEHPEPQTTRGELVHHEVRNEVLMPLDPDQVVAGMEAYQSLLPRLLSDSDYQQAERGKRFVKKSGWRKIARAFNLSLEIVRETVERDDEGQPVRAHVIARAVAPNGTYQDGDGYCAIDESRFSRSGGRQKVENDLRATATTRAKNRAIADLVGMGEVSAEEVASGGHVPQANPLADEASQEMKTKASTALTYLMDGDAVLAEKAWGQIKTACANTMPGAAAMALIWSARALKDGRGEDK
jgi:hypothetical protein